MTIDIVDLTADEYRELNAVQMAMVRQAQRKKDSILEAATKEKYELKLMLVGNGTVRSSMWTVEQARIDQEAELEIEVVKEDLKYQLAYEALASEGNENGPYRYPENPNYNLTPSQRYLVVRNYYMALTTNAQTRLNAFAGDSLARAYLGEFYNTLYSQLASYVK